MWSARGRRFPSFSNSLQASDDQVRLHHTDLEVGVRERGISAQIEKNRRDHVPARRLDTIVRNCPPRISDRGGFQNVASIRCGQSFFKISALHEEEFPPLVPKFDDTRTFTIPSRPCGMR